MTVEEMKKFLEEKKSEGYSEEELLKIFYAMYVKGDLELSDLRTLTEMLGWKFTDEFEALPEDEKKKRGVEKVEETEADKEEIEDAKEYETEPSSKDDGSDDGKDGEAEPAAAADDKKAPETKAEDEDEKDDDDKKAARLFGFGGKKD